MSYFICLLFLLCYRAEDIAELDMDQRQSYNTFEYGLVSPIFHYFTSSESDRSNLIHQMRSSKLFLIIASVFFCC